MEFAAHMAKEVTQHEVGAAPSDLEPERESAVGGERHGNRGFSDATALKVTAQEEPVAFEFAQDDGDSLGGQPGQACDFAARERALALDQGQDQPRIMVAQALLVRAAARAAQFGVVHGSPP